MYTEVSYDSTVIQQAFSLHICWPVLLTGSYTQILDQIFNKMRTKTNSRMGLRGQKTHRSMIWKLSQKPLFASCTWKSSLTLRCPLSPSSPPLHFNIPIHPLRLSALRANNLCIFSSPLSSGCFQPRWVLYRQTAWAAVILILASLTE